MLRMSTRAERRRGKEDSGVARIIAIADEAQTMALSAESVEEMRRILQEHSDAADRVQAQHTALDGQKRGYESLTTNTRGGRSAEWFDTGKYFSLGYATSCIAIGVFHEDVGLAGSHLNTDTVDDQLERLLKERPDLQTGVTPSTHVERWQRLSGIVAQATHEAIEEFVGLTTDGIIPNGTLLVSYGVTTQPAAARPLIYDVVNRSIDTNPIVRRLPGDIKHETHLGKVGQLAYGRKNNPQFSRPGLIFGQ